MKILPKWTSGILILTAFVSPSFAQLYWSGAGLNPATAGSGTWDNANMQWSSTFPGYTPAVWDSNIANFNGTARRHGYD